MDGKEIAAYREAYYEALCKQSEGASFNLPREEVLAGFRHLAFEKPDDYIEGLAAYYTAEEAAAEELQ